MKVSLLWLGEENTEAEKELFSFSAPSHTEDNLCITSGYGNQADPEITGLAFSHSSATPNTLRVMGAHLVH